MIDLIFKDIEDEYTRENFSRLQRFLADEVTLQGNFKFLEISSNAAGTFLKFKHNLNFMPKDLLVLSIIGDKNIEFHFELFTKEHIVFTTAGATRIRALVGSYG